MIKEIKGFFDKFTGKERCFIMKEEQLLEIIKMIDVALGDKYFTQGMKVNNCRKANEPDLWSIDVDLTNNQWQTLLSKCKEKKYMLIIKDDPDRMYFKKI